MLYLPTADICSGIVHVLAAAMVSKDVTGVFQLGSACLQLAWLVLSSIVSSIGALCCMLACVSAVHNKLQQCTLLLALVLSTGCWVHSQRFFAVYHCV